MAAILGSVILAAVLVWIGGDFLYASVVGARWRAWEAGIARGPDGVRADCEAFTVGDGSTALLMVHGFGDAPTIFRPMAEAFAARGYTCRVLRLPGFAEPMDAYARTHLAAWRGELRRELDELTAIHDEVWVIGHSTGAALAVREAVDGREDLAGLVLLAPLFDVSTKRSPLMKPRSWFNLLDGRTLFTRFVENPFATDAENPVTRDYPYSDRFVPLNVYRSLYALLDEVVPRADAVRVPVLMFVSTRDRVVDPAASEAFFEDLASERKTLIRVEDAGHVLPIDTGWEQRVVQTDEFIRGKETDA